MLVEIHTVPPPVGTGGLCDPSWPSCSSAITCLKKQVPVPRTPLAAPCSLPCSSTFSAMTFSLARDSGWRLEPGFASEKV